MSISSRLLKNLIVCIFYMLTYISFILKIDSQYHQWHWIEIEVE